MKRFWFVCLWLFLCGRAVAKPVKLDFHGASVSEVITLVYAEALEQPYVIDPDIVKDQRLVSFRFNQDKGDLRVFWRQFLESLGFTIEQRNGVDFVMPRKEAKVADPAMEPFVYRPKYRAVPYLTDLLSSLFEHGHFMNRRSVRSPAGSPGQLQGLGANIPMFGQQSKQQQGQDFSPTSAAGQLDQDSDTLLFYGPNSEVAMLRKLLDQVDVPAGEVVVRAAVYEVTTSKGDGTGFSLAANILGGHFGVSLGSKAATSDGSLTLHGASFDAALTALSNDSRFKVVTSPRMRVLSGAHGQLTVGQDVPTLGAITYPQGGGSPVQSVTYQSSGVILDVTPTVREDGIDLDVKSQISDFAATDTGVNNSPTLTKRELSTRVVLGDGDMVLIGGLDQGKDTLAHSGFSFLPKLLSTSSNNVSNSQIVLMLQVTKI